MGVLLFFAYTLLLPFFFVVYRKLEFAGRVRRSSGHGDCYVKKPVFTGLLARWVKRMPLDVTMYYDLFRKHGPTFTTHPFLTPLVMTIDPENVQTILATKFGEFDIGEIRQKVGQKYMRKGIFTQQGGDWHVGIAMPKNYIRLVLISTEFAPVPPPCLQQGYLCVELCISGETFSEPPGYDSQGRARV